MSELLRPLGPGAVGLRPETGVEPVAADPAQDAPRQAARGDRLELRELRSPMGQSGTGSLLQSLQQGLQQADRLVGQAVKLLQIDPERSPGTADQVYQLGERIMRLGDHTTSRGLYPLRESGQLDFPGTPLPTFQLLGDETALLPARAFVPALPPQQALAELQAGRERLATALEQVEQLQGQDDQRRLAAATSSLDLPRVQQQLDQIRQRGLAGSHTPSDPGWMTRLLQV